MRHHRGVGLGHKVAEDRFAPGVQSDETRCRHPDKRDLDLGKPLVFEFVRQFLPADDDKVREIFSRRGAYAWCRDLLGHRNADRQWQGFKARATEEALRAWRARKAIELAG